MMISREKLFAAATRTGFRSTKCRTLLFTAVVNIGGNAPYGFVLRAFQMEVLLFI